MTYLKKGELKTGWPLFEWSLEIKGRYGENELSKWKGENLNKKTILLCYEEGLGDTLQFLRFVPRFAQLGGKVALQCQPNLKPLLLQQKRLKVDNILDELDFSPNYDFTLSLLSFPAAHHVTSKEEIIIGRPYIEVL